MNDCVVAPGISEKPAAPPPTPVAIACCHWKANRPASNGGRRTVGIDNGQRIGQQYATLGRGRVADGRRCRRGVVDISNHLRRRIYLLQHPVSVLVDGPHPQCQANLGVRGRKGRAFLARHFAGGKTRDVCKCAIAAQIDLPEIGDGLWDRSGRVGQADVVSIVHPGDRYGHRLVFGRRAAQSQCANRLVVQAAEHNRLVVKQQPLDVHEMVGAVAGGHVVDDSDHVVRDEAGTELSSGNRSPFRVNV